MSDLGLGTYPAIDLWQIALDGTVIAENLIGRSTGVDILSYKGLGLPEQRTADMDLVSEHGVIALGDYHKARSITVEIGIHGQGACIEDRRADAWTQLRRLAGVWQARTKDVVLELCMTDGTTYALVGRPRKFADDTAGLRFGAVKVAAEFVATDPRLYGLAVVGTTLTYDVAGGNAGGLSLVDTPNGGGAATVLSLIDTPNGGGAAVVLSAQTRTTGHASVTHIGNTETSRVQSNFFGPAVNPEIINQTTGRSLSLLVTLIAGNVVVVDHHTRVVWRNGVVDPTVLGPATDFWPLAKGVNEIQFNQASGAGATATIVHRPAWL